MNLFVDHFGIPDFRFIVIKLSVFQMLYREVCGRLTCCAKAVYIDIL